MSQMWQCVNTHLWDNVAMCSAHLVEVPILAMFRFQTHLLLAFASVGWIASRTGDVGVATSEDHIRWCAGHGTVISSELDTLRGDAALNDDAQQCEQWPQTEDNVRSHAKGDTSRGARQQPVPVIAVAEIVEKPVGDFEILHKIIGTKQCQCTAVQTGGDDGAAFVKKKRKEGKH